MISIIITTHDGRLEFLKKALASVYAQTFKDYEIIVVDDASHDGTEEYCLKDKRIQYVRRDKCFGSDTRPKNKGTRLAKGEYICYLDSDVVYRKDHLQILYNTITKFKVDVAYGDRMVIDTNNRFPPQIGICSDFNPDLLMHRNYIDTSDVIIKRSAIFDVGGWDERYKKYVDWNLWVRMAKAGKSFVHAPYVITDYYVHDEMKSAKVMTKGDDMKAQKFVPEWNSYELEIDQPYLHTVEMPKIAVFSLTKNRLYYSQTCFKSLKEKAGYPFFHIVVDNGSTDGTIEWLEKEYKPDYLIKNSENKGISVAQNQAVSYLLKKVKPDIIIAVDNDCLLISDDIFKVIVEIFKKNKMVCLSPYVEGLRDNPGGAPRRRYGNLGGQFIGITDHVGGIFKATSSKPFIDGFRWTEDVPKHAFQDLEFSQYLVKHHYTLGYLENLRVEHFEGTTAQHERYPSYYKLRESERK